jgi:type VI secretion system secreted protein VgrG
MSYFDDPNNKHFSFQSLADGLDENTFGVINFKGFEAVSKPYDFEIMLVSSNKKIDLEDLLQAQAVFTIHRSDDDDVLYNGTLAEFDQLHEVNDVIFYRARLVPK